MVHESITFDTLQEYFIILSSTTSSTTRECVAKNDLRILAMA